MHVAQLAGIPKAVINRAAEILEELEAAGGDFVIQPRKQADGPAQLSFFQTDPDPVIKFVEISKSTNSHRWTRSPSSTS